MLGIHAIFNTIEAFRNALGKLTKEAAKALISENDRTAFIKAAVMTACCSAREEYLSTKFKQN